ncbi:hypothetical protein D3C77_303010 [compost metagenome]
MPLEPDSGLVELIGGSPWGKSMLRVGIWTPSLVASILWFWAASSRFFKSPFTLLLVTLTPAFAAPCTIVIAE